MILFIKNSHFICALLFALYIMVDRVYIRIFLEKTKREKIYKFIKIPMLLLAFFLVLSGLFLLFNYTITFLLVLKVVFALLLLFGFFFCPFYMKKASCNWQQVLYRWGVVVLLIITFTLGLINS